MSASTVQTRRTFLRRVTAVGAGALVGSQLTGVPGAVAATRAAPGTALDAGAADRGFRVTTRTRLSVLEADAGLAPIDPIGRFRPWALERVRRLEDHYGLDGDGRLGDPWRDWMNDRVSPLEKFLPEALRFPFYTHMPLATPPDQYGPVLRQRIADGNCNGIFLYMNAATPLTPTGVLHSIVNTGGPVPILMSPKNVSDPAKLAGWMDFWAARPEWIPYVRVAYWQEFQDDFGGAGQPPISAWQQGVTTLADAADRVGIASVAHPATWNLHPSQPQGGIPRLLEFLQPVLHRLGGGISWSVFVFHQETAEPYVQWMNDFMATYFPYTMYGATSCGDSLPPDTPSDDARRVERAARLAALFRRLDRSRVRSGGYYAVPDPSNPEWSFWDEYVEEVLTDALDDLTLINRMDRLRERDRALFGMPPLEELTG